MLPIKQDFRKLFAVKTSFPGGFWGTVGGEQTLIWAVLGGLALALWATGAENTLATALYDPATPPWAWQLRQYGTWPGMMLAVAALGAMVWPRLDKTSPLLWKTAVVVALSTLLGAGLVNQVVVKDIANRARPRETVLIAQEAPQTDGFKGHSMPSGHAAMGFVLAAPFFPLRRKKPRLAKAFLASGLLAGGVVGLARMVVGAHFASDILVAGALGLATASGLNALLEAGTLRRPMLPHRWIPWAAGVVALLTAGGFMAFNKITLELFAPMPGNFHRFDLPCKMKVHFTPYTTTPTVHVALSGYGAPVSNLKLVTDAEGVRLDTSRGFYHHLSCTAWVDMPGQ